MGKSKSNKSQKRKGSTPSPSFEEKNKRISVMKDFQNIQQAVPSNMQQNSPTFMYGNLYQPNMQQTMQPMQPMQQNQMQAMQGYPL